MESVVFDKETRKQIAAMRLKVNRTFAGEGAGSIKARGVGTGHDFHDHRSYVAGDDFRHIDWNLFGRHGDLFIKRFRQETDLEFLIVLDRTASMAVGKPSKDVFARRLSCALAACFSGFNQPFRILLANQNLTDLGVVIRSDSDLEYAMTKLEALTAPKTSLDERCLSLPLSLSRNRVVIFLGDFLDEGPLMKRLSSMKNDKTTLILGSLCAEEERAPMLTGKVKLLDLESERLHRLVIDQELLDRYRLAFQAHLSERATEASALGMVFSVIHCESDLLGAVINMAKRGALAR